MAVADVGLSVGDRALRERMATRENEVELAQVERSERPPHERQQPWIHPRGARQPSEKGRVNDSISDRRRPAVRIVDRCEDLRFRKEIEECGENLLRAAGNRQPVVCERDPRETFAQCCQLRRSDSILRGFRSGRDLQQLMARPAHCWLRGSFGLEVEIVGCDCPPVFQRRPEVELKLETVLDQPARDDVSRLGRLSNADGVNRRSSSRQDQSRVRDRDRERGRQRRTGRRHANSAWMACTSPPSVSVSRST